MISSYRSRADSSGLVGIFGGSLTCKCVVDDVLLVHDDGRRCRWDRSKQTWTHEEVAEDPTGTPDQTIGPSLDPALVFIEHEDCSRLDHASLPLYQSPGDSRDHPPPSRFEYQQGIKGSLDISSKGRVEGGRRGRHVANELPNSGVGLDH